MWSLFEGISRTVGKDYELPTWNKKISAFVEWNPSSI
jgi:hypothetical protein